MFISSLSFFLIHYTYAKQKNDHLTPKVLIKPKKKSSSTKPNFGVSVAVSDSILAVGAYGDDDKGLNSGAVYIYDITDGKLKTKITASDGAASDNFGHSLALSENILVVGSPLDDDKGINSGAVYYYDLAKGNAEKKITASDGVSGDSFGYSVALSGTTLAVGAFRDGDKGPGSGSVYLYDLAKASAETKITASDGAASALFAYSVALSGNILAVGAIEDNGKKESSGSVYLYDLAKGNAETKIIATDGARGDYFGYSLALSGSFLAVGAWEDDDKGSNSGSVYVYDLNKGNKETKITAFDGSAYDNFGQSLALSGTMLAVGAFEDRDKGVDSGSVYLFDLAKANTELKLTAFDGSSYDHFGNSVALSGRTLAVGAYKDERKNSVTGSVYLYDLDSRKLKFKIIGPSK